MTAGLSVRQLLAIQEALRTGFGGRAGVRDRGSLESAAARPFATFDGDDLYSDLPAKAAALLHAVVSNHPFVDGNKRTGALAVELFLDVNGADLIASADDLERVVMAVAAGSLDIERLVVWFRQRCRYREPSPG